MVQQEREADQLCYHEVTDITLPGYSRNTCCTMKFPYTHGVGMRRTQYQVLKRLKRCM